MEKPLPDLPQPSRLRLKDISVTNPTTLTIDAREHLHRFILQAIQDEGAVFEHPELDLNEWVNALESALGALAERLSLGGWLPGLRRARMHRREQRERSELGKASGPDTAVKKDESKSKTTETQEAEVKEVDGYLSIGRRNGRTISKSWRDTYRTLRDTALRPASVVPKLTAKHLLLTVAPYGSHPPPSSDDADNLGLPVVMCTFVAGLFILPLDDTSEEGVREAVLCGLDSWNWENETPIQIVGGTFFFHGVQSQEQHAALQKVLRLALFTFLSNILEQCMFMNSHVPLRFPKPALSPVSPSSPQGASISRALSTSNVERKHKRDSAETSGWWAYLSRKKENLLQRATQGVARRGSLELTWTRSLPRDGTPSPRMSSESTANSPTRSPRFSFISDYRPSFMQSQSPRDRGPEERPIAAALTRIERYRNLLSTSPSISYPLPTLLLALAEQEKRGPEHRLNGDEKAALMSLLGWEGKRACGAGMADMIGFVRQQSFSVLYSEYVQQLEQSTSRPETPATANTSSSSLVAVTSSQTQSQATQKVLCGKRWRWVTFRFFSREGGADECLGDIVFKLCSRAEDQCDQPGCRFKRREHELRLVHGSVRISVNVGTIPEGNAEKGDRELPEMWERCAVCGKESSKQTMHDGTYLMSFAKYLELLVYSPAMCTINPPLCQHTTPLPGHKLEEDTPLPQTPMNIIRNFAFQDHVVSFSLSAVTDVFEVRVPRLQMLHTRLSERPAEASPYSEEQLLSMEAEKRALRREILKFWQGLSEHIDRLEENFLSEHDGSHHKRLPRLPSADDAYDTFDEDTLDTPKLQTPKILDPPNTPQVHPITKDNNYLGYPFPFKSLRSHSRESISDKQPDATSSTLSSGSNTSSNTDQDSLQRLTNMRHTFQRTEQGLYAELSRTPASKLNDIRRSFQSAAKGATKRLSAWEMKHAAGGSSSNPKTADKEPEWWQNGCHAVPGGNIIVRENDWGSIIAFTLSSIDYQKELSNMSTNRPASNPAVPPVPPSTPTPPRPSFFGKTASGRWFAPSAPLPDPDQEGAVWYEPETYSSTITRKEHPRDPTSLLKLGLPDVLRSKIVPETGSPGPSKFATIGPLSGKGFAVGTPPSAYAKPEVQISKEEADGLLTAAAIDRADKILLELEGEGTKTVRTVPSTDSYFSSSSFVETNIRRGKASSIMSVDSDATVSASHDSVNLPTPPPKDSHSSTQTQSTRDSSVERREGEERAAPATIGASGFATALSSALRYMLKSDDAPSVPPKHYHGLLSTTVSSAIDDKPHIKYEWTIGKRLKFSCTAYYAKQFDALRRRCGIENVYVHSLARSENWAADGGKSRSNFWRTADNQFIIKTLVNAWNVADLHVLIELGPSYFRYMDATTTKPTLLAKLLGFYTVEIKNLETGTTQAKADLLVMENLFYQQNVVKMFDLKGIQGRKVKPSSSGAGSKTLFDGEWIEGQQRTLTLVRPYSKFVLQEAIKLDCDFLARSNIMDYSLLVGIDESKKQLACGLVDTIGSYTFAKTLEYKAKQGLNAGKEVTVVPPQEYQDRFMNAMDNYFVACPDKWSRPLDDTKIPGDYRQLPSVL